METMDFKKVGELIRKVRKERGMTLTDLADDYIPRTTLSAIERGISQNPVKVRYLLRKLEIDASEITEREKRESEERGIDLLLIENKINRNAKESLSELLKLPAEYESPLLDFLKGRCHFKMNQYDRAISFFNKALKSLEKSIDNEKTNLKACCLNHLSFIEFKRGKKEKALAYVEEGLRCFDLDGQRRYYYATLLINKAIYLRSLGRTEDAINALEKIEGNSFEISIDVALGIYVLQARLKQDIKLYDQAAYYAKKGLEIARINNNYERELELYIILGDIYREDGKLNRAEKFLKAAIDLKDQVLERQWLIQEAHLKLGIVHFEKKDFDLASKTFGKAKRIAKKENDMVQYSQALLFIARSYLSESKYQEALSTFMEVYELHSDEKTDLEALQGLMKVHLLLDDDANYIKYSKLYYKAKGLSL